MKILVVTVQNAFTLKPVGKGFLLNKEEEVMNLSEFQAENITEIEFLDFLDKGYIECKKSLFGRKKYEITQKGKDFFEGKMLDKMRYIQ